jgi:hypothetical protein
MRIMFMADETVNKGGFQFRWTSVAASSSSWDANLLTLDKGDQGQVYANFQPPTEGTYTISIFWEDQNVMSFDAAVTDSHCPVPNYDLKSEGSSTTANVELCNKAYADWAHCANQGQTCSCTGQVKYGAGNVWTEPTFVSGSVACNDATLGDPAYGSFKTCQCNGVAGGNGNSLDWYLIGVNGGAEAKKFTNAPGECTTQNMRLNTAWRARQINTGYLWYENVIVDAGTYSAEDKSDCYHANPTKFTLQESAPNSHIAGEQHQFHVQARDNKGNRVTKGGDMITIFARFGDYTADSSCADLAATNPGVYKCTWKAVKAGRYTVDVKVRDQHIADSPFYVDLVAGAAFAGTSMVSNVEPVLKVGLPSSFTIVPRDMYGNTITDLQANSFQVDIKSGGGGNPVNQWVKVLQYGNSPYTPTADAAGDLTADTSAGFAKLSDVDINEMFADQQGWYYYKMTDERSETLFVRTKKPFRDTDMAFVGPAALRSAWE